MTPRVMMRFFGFVFMGAALAASTGCAFANVDVRPPDSVAATTPTASGPGRGREIILASPFADARPDPSRCGMQKNGYNADTADVHCTEVPGTWLADALAAELARNGYKPLRGDAVPGPSSVVVRGTVLEMFFEPVDHFWTRSVEGDTSVKLVVTSPNGLSAERTFYVKGHARGIASTEGKFQESADDATQQIARGMVQALTELLDRYPELAKPQAHGAQVAMLVGGAR